ncbi:MAG: leucine-rich repeat protein [Bacilli bacterium]|nr:leucine-rich repeat protein [Bacilli bacterium]
MGTLHLEDFDLSLLSKLPVKEANRKRIDYINRLPLEAIPSAILPPTHETDYYFVSYSHLDYKEVYRDIFLLEEEGLSIWYDRGIPAGKDWKKTANNFMVPFECKGILFYISEHSLSSEAVLDEILYSIKLKKPFIAIHLPFSSDFVHNGESVKGKIFPVSKMLDIMKENGANIKEDTIVKIKEVFPDEMIFLPISMPAGNKAEKIALSLPEPPLFSYDPRRETLLSLNNPNAFKIEEDDFEIKGAGNPFMPVNYYLGDCCFANAINLESIRFPKGLMLVPSGRYAFHNCVKLESIERMGLQKLVLEGMFQNCHSLEYIGSFSPIMQANDFAFKGCHSLDFSNMDNLDMVNYIGREAFAECYRLESFSPTVETMKIGHLAFRNCRRLLNVNLLSPKEIGYSPFAGCERLLRIEIGGTSSKYVSIDGVLYIKEGDDLVLLAYPLGRRKIELDPACHHIGTSVFSHLTLISSIAIPEGVKSIGDFCFKESPALEEVTLPSTIESIGLIPFVDCFNLKRIKVNMNREKARSILLRGGISDMGYIVDHFDCLDGELPLEEIKR